MPTIHRRSFLERLSLGAGAFVLSPIIDGIVREARGATAIRKRFVVFTYCNGGYWGQALPPEVKAAKKDFGADLFQTSNFTMPYQFAPLAPYRNRMLLVDGLVNQQLNFGHFAGDLLTCVPKTKKGDFLGNNAGGQSFDQYVAGVIGRDTPFPSVHLGATTTGSGEATKAQFLIPGLFSKGPNQGVPVQMSPADAWKGLFPAGGSGSMAAASPMTDPSFIEKNKLLEFLTDDIKRARAALAGTERAKLDEHLAAIEETQKRLSAPRPAPAVGCGQGGPTRTQMDVAENVFPAQVDVAAAALTCGMTNVVTLSFLGIGKAFKSLFPDTDHPSGIDIHSVGHGAGNNATPPYGPKMINWWSGQLARLVERLSSVREGDGTVFDNTVILFASDNAESHHSRCWRYPVVLLGGAGSGLKADGRYVRYPTRSQGDEKPRSGPAGMRSIADLMCTLGHALGAPVNDWGKNGLEEVKGPLSELRP